MMFKFLITFYLLLVPLLSFASQQQIWDEGITLAQQGRDKEAIAMFRGAALQGNPQGGAQDVWSQRFDIASRLLQLRGDAKFNSDYKNLTLTGDNQHEMLMTNWVLLNPMPQIKNSVMPEILGSIIPGAGHAWMGRWGDAGVSAMLVWPLLILTFWAARRNMGPVTVFFALITAWLWSGTIFSATSLAERGDFEMYYAWWQQMWVASGLPARPW